MQHLHEFPRPSRDDYANVQALNIAYMDATSELKGPQRGRLASAPFLLFSLRENDIAWWTSALAEQRQCDFITTETQQSPELLRIQTAAISFLWQLSQRNPYATRIVSGASGAWCDTITNLPLVILLNRIAGRADLMISRLDDTAVIGARLLGSGASSRKQVRRSSQLTALQTLLTGTRLRAYERLPAAACNLSGPLQVMDKKL